MNARNPSDPDALERYKQWSAAALDRAANHWDSILSALAPSLQPALDRRGRHVKCPGHGGKDGFRVMKDVHVEGRAHCNTCGPFKGVRLVMWANGWTYKETIEAVGDQVGLPWDSKAERIPLPQRRAPAPSAPVYAAKHRRRDLDVIRSLDEMIAASLPIEWSGDNPATRYFVRRGLEGILLDPPQDLLLHPALEYRMRVDRIGNDGELLRSADGQILTEWKALGTWPAIIALIRAPSGEVVAAHRIWVTEDGRKPFEDWSGTGNKPQHKRLAAKPEFLNLNGCAVRLYGAGQSLGVGEGIETVLGARLLMERRQRGRKLPVWAATNAQLLETMEFPPYIQELLIFADHDPATSGLRQKLIGRGEEAARALRKRVLDRGGAKIFLPTKVSTDWLDTYNEYAARLDRINERYRAVWMPPEQLERLAQEAAREIDLELRAAVDDARDAPPIHEAADEIDPGPEDFDEGVQTVELAELGDSDVVDLSLSAPVQGYKGRNKPHIVLQHATFQMACQSPTA